MGLVFYADSNFTQPIRKVLGSLSDSGSSFTVSAEPDEVRKYNTSSPNGDLLTKNTSTPTSPGTGEWGYSNGSVYLGDSLTAGDVVVGFSEGQYVLEGVKTLSGKNKFATNTGVLNDRVKQQQIWLKNTENARQYTNISISLYDLVPNAGSEPTRYQFASDNNGTPNAFGTAGGTLTSNEIADLAKLPPNSSTTFWVKCTVPEDLPVENIRDIQFKIDYTEEATN